MIFLYILFTIMSFLYLLVGVFIGYYLYAPSNPRSPKQIAQAVKTKKVKVGAVKSFTAEELRKRNTPLGQAEEAVRKTFEKEITKNVVR